MIHHQLFQSCFTLSMPRQTAMQGCKEFRRGWFNGKRVPRHFNDLFRIPLPPPGMRPIGFFLFYSFKNSSAMATNKADPFHRTSSSISNFGL